MASISNASDVEGVALDNTLLHQRFYRQKRNFDDLCKIPFEPAYVSQIQQSPKYAIFA